MERELIQPPKSNAGRSTEGIASALPEKVEIPEKVYFRIGDVADILGVKAYVLRYWESEFPSIAPEKTQTGQRVYRRSDVETLLFIKHLLYTERYSIEGARKRVRELKRDGDLKRYQQEKVFGAKEASGPVKTEALQKAHELAKDLKALARAPVKDFFSF
jgi:DNA-binding transcriptional MerR regulator